MTKKNIHLTCITISLWLCISGWVMAQPPEGDAAANRKQTFFKEDIFLSDLIDYALKNNPSMEMARQKWQSTIEQYPIATALPDPQFTVTYFPKPIETRMGPQDWNATISQMFPFPGKRAISGKLVETDASVARLRTDITARQISAKVAAVFHELLYIRKAIEITRNNAKLLEELKLMAETEHAVNKAVFMDVIKAHAKLGQIRYDMLLLQELEETEKTALNALLNRPPDAFIGELQEPDIPISLCSLDTLYGMADDAQEEIAISRLLVKKANLEVNLARYIRRPNFKVGVFYAAIGDPDVSAPPADAGEDAVGIQLGINLPVWPTRNHSGITQAEARVRRNRASVEKTVNEIRARIRAMYFKLNNAERLISLYSEELIPQAMESMALAATWFREGEGAFSDFVEVQASVYNFQLSLARARADYGKTLALLQPLVGGPIDDGCITLNADSHGGDRHEN